MRVADLLTLVLQGLLVASAPLALVWALRGVDRLRRLAWLTAFVTFDLVVFGAFTRLTDSGLGCPDWPGCFARANPAAAAAAIADAQLALPGGPVDMQKAWIEMIHRTLAGAVALLIVTMVILTWRERRHVRHAFSVALAALALVVVQAAFGAFTVTQKLEPVVVTVHLLLGLLLLAVLIWLAARIDWSRAVPQTGGAALRAVAAAGVVVLFAQIALGGWVSTNYAVLACTDYPRCQGQLVPPMDFSDGFSLVHALGHTANGDFMPQAALTAMHWTHRNSAIPVALLLLAIAAWVWRETPQKREARNLALLVVLQWGTGLANVLFGWPLLAAVLHSAGAAAMLATLVLINYRLRAPSGDARRSSPARRTRSPSRSMQLLESRPLSQKAAQFYALTKPRVTQLAVFCAIIGMFLATPGLPPLNTVLAATLGIWLLAGAAFAINCLVEREIDARMARTARRPMPLGELKVEEALTFASIIGAIGMAVLYNAVNGLTMWLTFGTFVGYAIVYTVLLKPATSQNIVIGGAAGAMPPALGWAAVAGHVPAQAWLLVLIIFLWTPPHFWSLALYRTDDFRRSGLPMLPITHGPLHTRLQVFLYTVALVAATGLPYAIRMSGAIYLASAAVLGAIYLGYSWRVWRAYSDRVARSAFRYSIVYLALLFAALVVDHYTPI